MENVSRHESGGEINTIDPEPFGDILSLLSILTSLASLATTLRSLPWGPIKTRSALAKQVVLARDELRYIEVDVAVLRDLVGEIPEYGHRSFRPGRRVLFSKSQFERYQRTAQQLFDRLRRVLHLIHRIDKLLPSLPNVDIEGEASSLASLEGRLDHIICDRQQTIDQAISATIEIAQQLTKSLAQLVEKLRGESDSEPSA